MLRDLRRVEYLTQARVTQNRGEASRSVSDLQDLLDARVAEMRHQGRFSQAQAQSWLHTLQGVLEPAAAPLRLSAQHDGEGELRFARDGVFAGVVQDADFTRLFLGIWFHETSTMASWQMTQPTSSEAHPWP